LVETYDDGAFDVERWRCFVAICSLTHARGGNAIFANIYFDIRDAVLLEKLARGDTQGATTCSTSPHWRSVPAMARACWLDAPMRLAALSYSNTRNSSSLSIC